MPVERRTAGRGNRTKPKLVFSADKELKRRFEVLNHPWRLRILEALSERDLSCSQVVDEGLIPDLSEWDRSVAIPKLAYHFRFLREVGAIEVVERHARRGSTEQVCRVVTRAWIQTEDWAKLPVDERRSISRTMAQGLMARIENALLHDAFDQRIDRHLAWVPMELDQHGWSEMATLMDNMLDAAMQINRDAKERLKRTNEQPIRSTWGQVHFESAPVPLPADD